jgi:uncharacterized membrane protein YfcA
VPGALLGAQTWHWAVWLVPPMLAGVWVGRRSFTGASPVQFRARVLNLLVLIAALGVLRALLELRG